MNDTFAPSLHIKSGSINDGSLDLHVSDTAVYGDTFIYRHAELPDSANFGTLPEPAG